eukprot:gene12935-biopygen4809
MGRRRSASTPSALRSAWRRLPVGAVSFKRHYSRGSANETELRPRGLSRIVCARGAPYLVDRRTIAVRGVDPTVALGAVGRRGGPPPTAAGGRAARRSGPRTPRWMLPRWIPICA